MASDIIIKPGSLGESVTEATLTRWLKNDGEAVAAGEPICELETDKANTVINSPYAGGFQALKKAGENVKVGEIIARVGDGVAKAAAPASAPKAAPASAPAPAGDDVFSPAVRHEMRVLGVSEAELAGKGTGPNGRVTPEDVKAVAAARDSKPGAKPSDAKTQGEYKDTAPGQTGSGALPKTVAPTQPAPAPAASPAPAPVAPGAVKRTPMTRMRQAIARRLVEAQHTAAMLTTFNEIDMSAVMALRERYKDQFEKLHKVGLGFMSFFAKAVCGAAKHVPLVNAQIDGTDIVEYADVNLSVAVSTEKGLTVPVLRRVQDMSFAKIESEIKRVATLIRDGKSLAPDELSGGTFTITNGGVFGSLLSTPIINPPQSAILGLHKIEKRPVVVNDAVVVRPMMYVALSYDHRLLDGKEAVTFLVKVKELIEDPARLLIEV
jgi:2-oxoglutarate dehydrogenase E2 component (dihydrolipoamide succinyltransferase)